MKETKRNPSWSRDELILALDLYHRHHGNPPGKTSKEIVALSNLLNEMSARLSKVNVDFRNPNGVYMTAMNFRRFDPKYLGQGKKGLTRGGKLGWDVWIDFVGKPDVLANTANAIRAIVKGFGVEIANDTDDETFEAEEGRVLTRVHLTRERNRKLVEQKKLTTLKKTGGLACEVCAFEFKLVYGERGEGFIEAHHVKPIHTLLPGQKTKLEDLALVCSNCHRMIHARRPWLTIKQLRDQLAR